MQFLTHLDSSIELNYGAILATSENLSWDDKLTQVENGKIRSCLPTSYDTSVALLDDALLEWSTLHGDRLLNEFYSEAVHTPQEFSSFKQGVADCLLVDLPPIVSSGDDKVANRCELLESSRHPSFLDLEALMALEYSPAAIQDDENISATVAELISQSAMVDQENSDDNNNGGSDEEVVDSGIENDSLVAGGAIRQMIARNEVSLDTMSMAILSIESRLKRQGILFDPRSNEYDEKEDDFLDDALVYQSLGINQDDQAADQGEDVPAEEDEALWTTYMPELFVADNLIKRDGLDVEVFLKVLSHDHLLRNAPEGERTVGWRPVTCSWLESTTRLLPKLNSVVMTPESQDLDFEFIPDLIISNKQALMDLEAPFEELQIQKFYYPAECRPLGNKLFIDGKQFIKLGKAFSLMPLPIGPLFLQLLHTLGRTITTEVENKCAAFDFLPSTKNARNRIINDEMLKEGSIQLPWLHNSELPLGDRPEMTVTLLLNTPDKSSEPKKPTAQEKQIKRKQKLWDDKQRLVQLSSSLERTVHRWSYKVLSPLLSQFYEAIFNLQVDHRLFSQKIMNDLKSLYHRSDDPTVDSDCMQGLVPDGGRAAVKIFDDLQSVFQSIEHRYEPAILIAMSLSWMSSTKTADDWKEITCKAYMESLNRLLVDRYESIVLSEITALLSAPSTGSPTYLAKRLIMAYESYLEAPDSTQPAVALEDTAFDILALQIAYLGMTWTTRRSALSHLHSSRVKKVVADAAKKLNVRSTSLFSSSGRHSYGLLFGSIQILREHLAKATEGVDGSGLPLIDQLISLRDMSKFPVIAEEPVEGVSEGKGVNEAFSTMSFYHFLQHEVIERIWMKKFHWNKSTGILTPCPKDQPINVVVLGESGSYREKLKGVKSTANDNPKKRLTSNGIQDIVNGGPGKRLKTA
eukprot:GHVH01005849.1.p2 GENE.GHVH01005849.1~~GHVH01005849.1.p2  ORF type:complete len:918 (+),score=156.65 GHVH01005849.1:2006-4759(+)